MYRYADEHDDFEKIWGDWDRELKSRGFSLAKPWSGEWEVEGRPWVKERGNIQIWVYVVPQWDQQEVMGRVKKHHSIYGHIQLRRVLDRFELKPRSLSSLRNMKSKGLEKVDYYLEQMETGLPDLKKSSQSFSWYF